MLRRSALSLVGFARQAAGSSVLAVNAAAVDAASGSRMAWLSPVPAAAAAACPAAAGAATPAAAAAAAPRQACHAARGITSSSAVQHTSQPAPEQQQQGQAAAARPAERDRNCWQCGTVLAAGDLFVCPACDSVQPAAPEPQYFAVFGM